MSSIVQRKMNDSALNVPGVFGPMIRCVLTNISHMEQAMCGSCGRIYRLTHCTEVRLGETAAQYSVARDPVLAT
jgi:hypothetical protein